MNPDGVPSGSRDEARRSHRRTLVPLLIAFLTLSACTGEEDLLGLLKDDDLASVTLPIATQTRVTEGRSGSFGGFESPVTIRHTFAVPRGTEQASAETLARLARAAGWTVERGTFGYVGSKEADDGIRLDLRIQRGLAESRVSVEISTRGN